MCPEFVLGNTLTGKVLALALLFPIVLLGLSGAGSAQAPTEEELTIRPGDKITWRYDPTGHVPQFGGRPDISLLADVQKVINFEPPLDPLSPEIGIGNLKMTELVGTVREDAAISGVKN